MHKSLLDAVRHFFSELLEITQTSFQQTLKDFPNMLQTFQELKLKIKNGDTSSVRTFDFQSFPDIFSD